jgi:phosphoglucomutase/phosphomannomutase
MKHSPKQWLDSPYYDSATKDQIRREQKESPVTLEEAFSKDLEFGTGGMRAIMGPGTNRLNIYTIERATQALANYINDNLKTTNHPRAIICYDSRHNSKLFAHHAAKVLASNQIEVWISNDIRPTPFASFMVRRKEAAAGIMITASHNTAEYNGYKVYGPDGAQVVFPHDEGIMKEYEKITTPSALKEAPHLIHLMDSSDDAAYLKAIGSLKIHGKESNDFGGQIRIVYTSLHGCGICFIPKGLKEWGFSDLHLVDKQCVPDGNFPTVKKPNPEEASALSLGISALEKEKADLLIATDPDADRVGIVCMHNGSPHILSGNEVATLCLYHLVNTMQQKGLLTRSDTVISTIVTTRLLKRIAEDFNILYMDTLTGFKYIGEKIALFEKENPPHRFLFGAEESYGYLIGTHARDKDATIASCFIAEMALHLKLKNQTLVDQLYDIYQLYGIYQSDQEIICKEHTKIMQMLRDPKLTELGGLPISRIDDYKTSLSRNTLTGESQPLNLPKSDVILFKFEDESEIVVRPSGTEPKLKIYGSISLRSFIDVPTGIKDATSMLKKRLKAVKEELEHLMIPCA